MDEWQILPTKWPKMGGIIAATLEMIYCGQPSECKISLHFFRMQNLFTPLPEVLELYPISSSSGSYYLNKVQMHVKFLRYLCCGPASS